MKYKYNVHVQCVQYSSFSYSVYLSPSVSLKLWVNAQQKFQLNSFVSENVDTFEQLFVFVSAQWLACICTDVHTCTCTGTVRENTVIVLYKLVWLQVEALPVQNYTVLYEHVYYLL